MGFFIRHSSGPSDRYGAVVYYVDDMGFVRYSSGPSDKYGSIVYYIDDMGFVRNSSGPSDRYGAIVYYTDGTGFVRQSNGPSDKYGSIVYYFDESGFVRQSNGPSDKYGQIVFFVQEEQKKKEDEYEDRPKRPKNQNGGILLLLAFVIGLIFAPILIVLGMFGKFLLGGLFKNVLPIEAFKKFRKTYSIISLSWLVLGIAAIVLLACFQIDVTIALYALVGGNILLFILSIVIGNKIYNEHKDELPEVVVDEVADEPTMNDNEVEFASNESIVREADNSEPESVHGIEHNEPATEILDNLDAIKKLKELLDLGILTKKEFEEKKKEILGYKTEKPSVEKKPISAKTIMTTGLVLSLIGLLTFIVGAVFLNFSMVDHWVGPENYQPMSYLEHAFNFDVLAIKFDWLAFLAASFGIATLICLIVQCALHFLKKKGPWKMIIVDVVGLLFASATISLGFVGPWDAFALVCLILVSVSTLFILVHLITTIVYKVLESKKMLTSIDLG